MKKILFFMLMLVGGVTYGSVNCGGLEFDGANDESIIIFLPTTDDCDNPTFEIFLRIHDGGLEFTPHLNWEPDFDSDRDQAIIRGLKPCTAYDIRVYVYCDGEFVGGCETELPYSTDGCDDRVDCNDLFDGAHETAIIINWPTTTECENPNYVISLNTGSGYSVYTNWEPLGSFQAIIRELDPCTEYDILVEVFCGDEKIGECELSGIWTDGCRAETEEEFTEQLTAFPNPSVNQTSIKIKSTSDREMVVNLMTKSGTFVKSFIVITNTEQTVNLSGIRAGLYYLRYISDDGEVKSSSLFIE